MESTINKAVLISQPFDIPEIDSISFGCNSLDYNKNLLPYTHHLFIFANPRSGDQAAAKFISPKFETFRVAFSQKEVDIIKSQQRNNKAKMQFAKPYKADVQTEVSELENGEKEIIAFCQINNVTDQKSRDRCE